MVVGVGWGATSSEVSGGVLATCETVVCAVNAPRGCSAGGTLASVNEPSGPSGAVGQELVELDPVSRVGAVGCGVSCFVDTALAAWAVVPDAPAVADGAGLGLGIAVGGLGTGVTMPIVVRRAVGLVGGVVGGSCASLSLGSAVGGRDGDHGNDTSGGVLALDIGTGISEVSVNSHRAPSTKA